MSTATLFDLKTEGLPAIPAHPPKSIITYQKRVMIALPWQKQVNPITSFCAAQLMDKRRTSSMLCFGDAFVAHSRNHCVNEFLKTDLEWILMIDDDMLVPFGQAKWFRVYTGWDWYPEPFASFNTIDRLMSHGKSIVGVCYFGRHPHGPPVFATGASSQAAADYARKGPHDEIMPTSWVGTGAILINRQVFLDIEKKYPLLARDPKGDGGQWFTSSEHTVMDGVQKVFDMLADGPMDGQKALRAYSALEGILNRTKTAHGLGVGEDVIFCRRAGECGHQPFVDLGIIAGHIGHTVYGPRNTLPKKLLSLKDDT